MNVNMNVNKKLGRFKQWAGERMGGEVKTDTSDDFKSLEVEMGLRQNGFEKMQKSMAAYVKSLSKRNEGDDKEKSLPVANLGSIMVKHGEDFEDDNLFGKCLQGLGSTNERIGRIQETYVQDASTSWLDSLERSNVQMKEYNAARKKLESRRLAYDTAVAKMDKLKKDDFRVEEEHRSAKEKYEYSVMEVRQRMDDIKEAEADSVADLQSFLDAELKYHDRCKEALMLLKEKWPQSTAQDEVDSRKNSRQDEYEDEFAAPKPVPRPTIRATRTASNNFGLDNGARPGAQRASTFEGPRQLQRDVSPFVSQPMSRVPSDNVNVKSQRDRLRAMSNRNENQDVFGDGSDSSAYYDSPERSHKERSASPATSLGSVMSRKPSYSNLNPARNGKKAPPPPPPPRSKKPPPPPPPSNHKPLLY